MPYLTFPQWEKSIDTIFRTSESKRRVVVKPLTTYWQIRHMDRNCLSASPFDCVILNYGEIPTKTKTIHFQKQERFKLVHVEQLARPASLEWINVDSIPQINNFMEVKPYESNTYRYFKDEVNQIVYIYSKSNGWGKWREVICTTAGYFNMFTIQEALKRTGYYSAEITGIINEETKKALIQFQKDNQLHVGMLDYYTLRALDLYPEPHKTFQRLNEW